MTKPKEKTREELTAEIEENEKKVRQYQNREKIIKQKCAFAETIDSDCSPSSRRGSSHHVDDLVFLGKLSAQRFDFRLQLPQASGFPVLTVRMSGLYAGSFEPTA